MGEIIRFNTPPEQSLRRIDPEKERKWEVTLQEKKNSLAAFRPKDALAVRSEHEDREHGSLPPFALPRDLDAYSIDDPKLLSFQPALADKAAFDALSELHALYRDPLVEDGRRAANNLIQLKHVGAETRGEWRAGISLPSHVSREMEGAHEKIDEAWVNNARTALQEMLGAHTTGEIDLMKRTIRLMWESDAWKNELEARKEETRNKIRALSGPDLLAHMKFIQGLDVEAPQSVTNLESFRRQKRDVAEIEEAQQAFREGDPATIKGHLNPKLESAAQAHQTRRKILSHEIVRITYAFLREKLFHELRKQRMSSSLK